MKGCCCSCGCGDALEFKIKKGENAFFPFKYVYDNDEPVDLTNAIITMKVRENVVDDGEYLIEKSITTASSSDGIINSPTTGEFQIVIHASDIEDLLTTQPYYAAVYCEIDNWKICISANGNQVAKFLVLNP